MFVVDATFVTTTPVVNPASVALVTIKNVSPDELSTQFEVVVVAVTAEKVNPIGSLGVVDKGVNVNILLAKLAIATLAAKLLVVGEVAEVFTVGVAATVTNADALAVLLELWKMDLVTEDVLEFKIFP